MESAVPSADARTEFGLGRLILADSRLAFIVLNEVRHWGLNRVFGTSRAHANLLTFVLALSAAEGARELVGRVPRMPPGAASDAARGALLLREAAIGLAGPQSRNVPLFAVLVTAGVLGGAVVHGARRATRGLRNAEQRARAERISHYIRVSRRARTGSAAQDGGVAGPAAGNA
jgi:hypothetical protein